MTDTLLSKGLIFGECFTTGCATSGSEVKGIAGQARMWGPNANHQHRCKACHGLIRAVLETALSLTVLHTGLTEHQAVNDDAFVSVGKQILAMDLDQLKGAKL